ncbi:hypothetical protein Tco_0079835 [Tanacetum coccineum]
MNQNFYNSNSFGFDQSQPPQFPVIHQPPQETSVEMLQAKEDLMISIETFLKKFNRISFRETPKVLLLAWEKFFEIKHREKQHPLEDIQELIRKLLEDVQNISEELAEYINSREPDNSQSIGDDHLDTIPATESDEVHKVSVENLSQSQVSPRIFTILKVSVMCPFVMILTFYNPLFDSDDESFSDEDVSKEIYLNPLFDEEIISDKIDAFLRALLYDNSSPRPPKELNSTESFPPSHIPVEDSDPFMEEIDLFLASDESIPPGIYSDYSDSEGDNLFLERLLHDDPTPLLEFFFDTCDFPL